MTPQKVGTSYYAHTFPGLQSVAWSEARARLRNVRLEGTAEVRARNGLVFLDYPGDARDMLALRTIEDLFVVTTRLSEVPWGREGLATIFENLRSGQGLGRALHIWQWLTGARVSRNVTFRVIARLSGARQPYRRLDLERAVASAVRRATKGRWQLVDSGEDVELWANLIHRQFI